MIYTVETKDPSFRIFCYESYGLIKFSDDFIAWYKERGLIFLALSRGLSEVPLTLQSRTFAFTDNLQDLPDNEVVTSTFYFGDPEIAMLFRLTWA